MAAIPAQSLRAQLATVAEFIDADAVVLSLAKGLESATGLRMTEVIAQALAEHTGSDHEDWVRRSCVLSGPNLAMEIAREEPTASVVAAPELTTAAWVARCCAAPYFRPYTNTDVTGTEIGGLVKNVIALCVGICDGRGYGDNSKASVMTRGLAETTRLALALGGDLTTLSGLSGMGDLVATCSSSLSRNHTAGKLLGSGLTIAQVQDAMTQTAEAIRSAPAVLALAQEHDVEMPITEAVWVCCAATFRWISWHPSCSAAISNPKGTAHDQHCGEHSGDRGGGRYGHQTLRRRGVRGSFLRALGVLDHRPFGVARDQP